MRSFGGYPGYPKIPCAECERHFPLEKWGDLCPECLSARQRRAKAVARRVALAGTALVAIWISFRLPPDGSGRVFAIVGVIATYLLVRRIATQVAMEFMSRKRLPGGS